MRCSAASVVHTASVAVAEEDRVIRTSLSEHSGRSSENCVYVRAIWGRRGDICGLYRKVK